MDKVSGLILATAFCPGATHDFSLFKTSRLYFAPQTEVLADSGYLGIKKRHHKAKTPHKNSKLHRLTVEEKQENQRLARQRVQCENTFAFLKRFAILRGPYRNRTKRLALRFNLIAALQNRHL